MDKALIMSFMNSGATEVGQTGYIIHELCELNSRHKPPFHTLRGVRPVGGP
jgi:hypothetical protein